MWGVVAMGDRNAVDYTQVSHCNVLRRAGCLHDADLLLYSDPLPTSGSYEGVMVDNHVVLQKVPQYETTAAGRAAEVARVDRALEHGVSSGLQYRDERVLVDSTLGYTRAHLERKTKKSARLQTQIEVWGAHVEGKHGGVRSKEEILGCAVALCLLVLEDGFCSVSLWVALLGYGSTFCSFGAPDSVCCMLYSKRAAGATSGMSSSFHMERGMN